MAIEKNVKTTRFHLKVNIGLAQTASMDDQSLEIERIYILNAYHEKEGGQLLYEQACKMLPALGNYQFGLALGKESTSDRENGFVAFDTHIFKLGDDEQTDLIMRTELGLGVGSRRKYIKERTGRTFGGLLIH